MSDSKKFLLREWLVPPILAPLFLGLLILFVFLIQG